MNCYLTSTSVLQHIWIITGTLLNGTDLYTLRVYLIGIGWDMSDIHMSVHRNIITNYSQQDATFIEFIYFYRRSTYFRRFLRPSSGAHNCKHSFKYCQPILLLAATVEEMEGSSISSTVASKFKKSCILLAVICNYITMHGHINIRFVSVVNEQHV